MIRGADRRGVLAGLVLLGLGACRRAPERRESSVEPPQAPAVLDLSDLERTHGGRIGLAAAERRAVAWRGDERFNYCSTFKLFLAACVLERASREQETLDRPIPITAGDILPHWPTTEGAVGRTLTISELAQATVELSDNAAANILIREIGGLDVLRAWYRAMGDETTSIDRLEPALNVADGTKDTTTANQTVQNLNWMEETYRPFTFQSPHRPLWDWLIDSPTGRGRIRAGVPNGWTVAHKTGTGGTGQTNDIGYAYAAAELPVRIAVYYDAPESLPLERREAVVAEASRRALAALGHGRPDDAPAAARAAT